MFILLHWKQDNRRTDAKLHIVCCGDCRESTNGGADEDEFIESTWLPLADFEEKLRTGKITNYAVLAAWALYIAKHPQAKS